MRSFFDDRQLCHAPDTELHNGAFVRYAEHGGRVASILAAIGPTEPAVDHGGSPLARIHDADYLEFLQSAHAQWRAAGRSGDAFGYAWPVVRRRPLALDRIDAKLGLYSYDSSSPIAAGTWDSAYWSAQSALTALDAVLQGERAAFALCRPPGHHSGAGYLGGYCHINSAAVAAQAARDAGYARVAILDIDYHHGNGTQSIFYEHPSVLFCSLHAHPDDDYPYYWGEADELGAGPGLGFNRNWPLPQGIGDDAYLAVLDEALAVVRGFDPAYLVVSVGFDTAVDDPVGGFRLTPAGLGAVGQRLKALERPTVLVQEGGYLLERLGENALAFLEPFAA